MGYFVALTRFLLRLRQDCGDFGYTLGEFGARPLGPHMRDTPGGTGGGADEPSFRAD
jgi:hypothetical protein